MTHTIKQITGSDCFLACVAMAKGVGHIMDLWTFDDIKAVVATRGVGDETPWMEKAALAKGVDYKRISVNGLSDYNMDMLKALLCKRRAILSVKSLNIDGGSHAVYWDGEQLHDPSTQRTYQWLSSLTISQVLLFSA